MYIKNCYSFMNHISLNYIYRLDNICMSISVLKNVNTLKTKY